MKKRVLAVLCTVLICFNCLVLPVMASAMFDDFSAWLVDTALQATINKWKYMEDNYYTKMTKAEVLAYWESIALNSSISRSAFINFYDELSAIGYGDIFAILYSCAEGTYSCSYNDFYNYIYDIDTASCDELLQKIPNAVASLKELVNDYKISGSLFNILMFDGEWFPFSKLWMAADENNITSSELAIYIYGTGDVPIDNENTAISDDGYVEISGELFAEICERLQSQYAPASQQGTITYCTDTRWQSLGYTNRSNSMSAVYKNQFCGTSHSAIYLVPFYRNSDGEFYYSSHQYYFYFALDENSVTRLNCDVYDIDTGEKVYSIANPGNFNWSTHNYADFSVSGFNAGPYIKVNIFPYNSYEAYIAGSVPSVTTSVYSVDLQPVFYSVDKYKTYDATAVCAEFKNTDPASHGVADYGFLFDASYISFKPFRDINTTMIDPTATVTLAGDTIYEYTITNSEGDSTTINYYINNNYTFPESDDETGEADDDNGGTVGGDVTVGGKVDVSGDINVGGEVDININVNQDDNGGADVDPYDYEEVNLGEAFEQIPEMGDGFKSWFARMFDWLPPEVLGLIIGGLSLAILLRIAGR